MANQVSVRSAVFESLHSILSADKAERECAEEKLKVLEITEDYGLVLTEICIDPSESVALKQLAAVLLRQYVDVHWSEDAEKFSPPEAPDNVRMAIRSLIPRGLTEPNSRVRSIVAYVISSIAHWDWPQEWAELFNLLMQALSSADKNAVHGSMRVLTEFTRDITDTQMIQIAPVLLPELYRVFIATEQYSNRSRSRVVVIFTTCVNVIISLAQLEKGHMKQLLVPVLPRYIDAFLKVLQSKDCEVTDTGMKTEVMKALTVLVKNCRSHMGQQLKQVVTSAWQTLVDSCERYLQSNIYEDGESVEEDPVDSDGEALGSEALIYSVFEFISLLVDLPKFHPVIKENIKQLLYYITVYTQITTDQEMSWSQSANQFVEDEDDETFSFSVRISAQDLLQAIIGEFDVLGLQALAENIPTHLQQANELKQAGNSSWWKVPEAVLLAIGKVPRMFVDAVNKGNVNFDLANFLHSVVLGDLMQQGVSLLTGRCLWIASKLSHCMQVPLLQEFLKATVLGLSESQPPCVRVSAVRAACHFCENLIRKQQTDLLAPVLSPLFEGAMSIAQAYGTEVLALCLESLEVTLRVNSEFTASVTEKSMPLFMAVFLKYSHDQHIIELCKELIMHVAVSRNDLVQQKMLPTLVSIIQQQQPDSLPPALQPGSLDMVQTLVRGCKDNISDSLMAVFPMIANLTIATDDSSIMQNGGECLRAFISTSPDQVVAWRDDRGHTGLYIIGSVVSKLLDPKAPEHSAAYVGKLVSLLITKLGDSIGTDLDLMLRAVLSKLQRTDTPTIVQELIMVFARLVLMKVDSLLDFLTMTPGPDGDSALKFVLTQWCSRQHLFYGSYETKVSTMALSKLLEHAINTNDTRLQGISMREEVISQSGIRTRAKAKSAPLQWTDTPILIKMYKLLINELAHQLEESQLIFGSNGNGHSAGEDGDYADDDDDEDEGAWLSELVDGDLIDDEDGDECDPDVLSDPIYHVNLKDYLTQFIKSFSTTQHYETFRVNLTAQEQSVISMAVGACNA